MARYAQSVFAFVVLATSVAWADAPRAEAESPPAVPDLLNRRLDPFDHMSQRSGFLTVAGMDMELSAAEFQADQEGRKQFVQVFDRWQEMLRHDRNGNRMLDFFEAEAYRRAMRRSLLRRFDKNGDGHLRGEERPPANAFLASGRFPGETAGKEQPGGPQAAPGGAAAESGEGQFREMMFKQYDKDGDGELSEAEWEAARADQQRLHREQLLRQWDTDGDGELSEAERQAMRESRRAAGKPWERRGKAFMLKHFDLDDDGELSDEEKDKMRQFGQRFRQVAQGWERRVMDMDRDGQVTETERRMGRLKYAPVMFSMMQSAEQWMDTDGDGQVSPDERTTFMRNAANRAFDYFADLTEDFDVNGNGRLDESEHDAFFRGIDEDVTQRIVEADADENGDISPLEMRSLYMGIAEDMGIKPSEGERWEEAPRDGPTDRDPAG